MIPWDLRTSEQTSFNYILIAVVRLKARCLFVAFHHSCCKHRRLCGDGPGRYMTVVYFMTVLIVPPIAAPMNPVHIILCIGLPVAVLDRLRFIGLDPGHPVRYSVAEENAIRINNECLPNSAIILFSNLMYSLPLAGLCPFLLRLFLSSGLLVQQFRHRLETQPFLFRRVPARAARRVKQVVDRAGAGRRRDFSRPSDRFFIFGRDSIRVPVKKIVSNAVQKPLNPDPRRKQILAGFIQPVPVAVFLPALQLLVRCAAQFILIPGLQRNDASIRHPYLISCCQTKTPFPYIL